MSTEEEYRFTLNVSTKAYPTKLPNNKVGGITFQLQTLTLKELESLVKQGYAFCYPLKNQSQTDVITMRDKTKSNFGYTNVLFFDFDHMKVGMQEFINGLVLKPSFAYTSFSNAPENNDCRYRLVYAFSDGIKPTEATTANLEFHKVFEGVGNANGFADKVDKKAKQECQYFNGSKADCETYSLSDNSYTIYSISDFQEFYPTSTFPFENKDIEDGNTSYSEMENLPRLNEEFYNDLMELSHVQFLDKYMPLYEEIYVKSLSTELTLKEDKSCYLIPSDYLEVLRKQRWIDKKQFIGKWQDGEGRRRKLYITAKVMLHNVHDMSLEQLVYNLYRERMDYYDNKDGQLRKDLLIEIAESAFKYRSIPIKSKTKKKYKVNNEYWAAKGVKPNTAKNLIKKQLHDEEVLSVYDFSKSVKDNLETLKALGIKAGKSYLYEFVKRYDSDGKNASTDNTDTFPFENKDKEDDYTSYSQMENLPRENERRTLSKEDEEFIKSITIEDDFDDDDYDDSFEVDLFFRLRGL